ncbi:glycosyltransferase WbuB [Clostridium sp. AF15-17LB]|nr:glycosyltransferase WbuB [Clostridium sp. AF15-17LB]
MNIWIVNHYAIPPSMGGLVRHYYFSKYLQKKGHKVKIFTSSKIHNTNINLIEDKVLYKEIEEDGVVYTFVRNRNYSGNGIDRIINLLDFPVKVWRTLRIFARRGRPDVIYASSPDLFTVLFSILFGKRRKIPVAVEIRDLWPESIVAYNSISKRNIIIKILYQMEKWIYTQADRIIFTMAGGKEYIENKKWTKKVDLNKIYHINNGVDVEEFDENAATFRLQDEELEDDNYFKVIYTGSIRRANGVDKIVEIATWLQNNGEDNIRFLIYGDGNEKHKLEKICRERKLNNIFFKGKVEKKYIPYILMQGNLNYMHGINTEIMRYGCSPNKLFDYIASEKPIISDLAPKYDLIKKYNLGRTLKNHTAEQVAKVILEFSKMNKSEYDKISDNCKKVKELYDYKRLSEAIEEVLELK